MINPELNIILRKIWESLAKSTEDLTHPWRLASLGMQSINGPSVRTMVLRSAIAQTRTLTAYTDIRSTKISNFRQDPRVAWAFYNHKTKEQVRANGRAILHYNNKETKLALNTITKTNLYNYSTPLPPGTKINPKKVNQTNTTEMSFAISNFAIIDCNITCIDWLQISPEKHLRAQFNWNGYDWNMSWVTP